MEKIAIISNTSWYLFNFRINLIKRLLTEGFQVIAIAPPDEYSSRIEEIGCRYYPVKIDSKSKNPLVDIGLTINLIKAFRKVKPELLINFTAKPNIYSTIVGRFLGIPAINNIAGLGLGFVNESLTTRILRILYHFSQKKASVVFFQNPDDLSEFVSNKMVVPNKCSLLPGSGVDLKRFRYSSVPSTIKNKFTFLLISRLLFSKGIEILFQAAKRIYESGNHDFLVKILGEAGVNNADAIPSTLIKKWSEETFFEYIGKTDDVVPFIEEAHCIILPSYYREGTPKSLLEGLAIGRPIITTDMPGCKNTVIESDNGYLVPPKDINTLAKKMERVMTLNYKQLQRMGLRSRKLAEEKFDEAIVVERYLEEIENVVKK